MEDISKKNDLEFIDNIVLYIKSNISNCNFSIAEMAANFSMSPPNLSQYFKERTGQNFIDYVTFLRLEKAKQLLVLSDLQLKDIATKVGYFNVSSFIRRFKQIIGTTPGEYRNDFNNVNIKEIQQSESNLASKPQNPSCQRFLPHF